MSPSASTKKRTATPPAMMSLRTVVQKNCHISDAQYAGDYSLCTYLLQMREYYRWEKGLGFGAKLPHQMVARWVARRERAWERLQTGRYVRLRMNGRHYDPFDNEGINRALRPLGLVYSGGYGRFCKPHFFLARLMRVEQFDDYTILVCADEYARDLTAPPAMTSDRTIFVRRESLRRLIWQKVEEWRWTKKNSAMTRALAHVDVERDPEAALEHLTEAELEAAIFHELGEIMAGEGLGAAWQELLLSVARTPAELVARAVRDNLADCLTTLPALLELENWASVHFYFANLGGMRKTLFPALAAGYQHWVEAGDLSVMKKAIRAGRQHWLSAAREILTLHGQDTAGCARQIATLAGSKRL